MQTDLIQRQLQNFIAKNFPVARKRNVGIGDRLLGEGIIDSLGVLDIVGYLEHEFQISIADEDLSPENFETIARLTTLVERKLLGSKGDTWSSNALNDLDVKRD